jgi:hypothetical protein
MTFLRYSRFMSSSLLAVTGESGREVPAGWEEAGVGGRLTSEVLEELQ